MPQGTNVTDPNAAISLKEAVAGAFKDDGLEDDVAVVPAEEGAPPAVRKEPTVAKAPVAEVEDETFEIDASAEEIGHALALHRSLVDPNKRNGIIQQLIEKSGYKIETKAQAQQFADDLQSIFKEELGESYELLSGDKLQRAVERAVTTRVEKTLAPVLQRIQAAEEHTQRQLADAEMASLWERNKIAAKDRPKLAEAMTKKMRQIAPGEGVTAGEYMDDILSLVNRDAEKARAVTTTVKRIRNNANDANTASGGSDGDDTRIKTGSRLPSANEAVAAAFRNERLEE